MGVVYGRPYPLRAIILYNNHNASWGGRGNVCVPKARYGSRRPSRGAILWAPPVRYRPAPSMATPPHMKLFRARMQRDLLRMQRDLEILLTLRLHRSVVGSIRDVVVSLCTGSAIININLHTPPRYPFHVPSRERNGEI